MNNAQLIITIIKWILIVFIMIEAYTGPAGRPDQQRV